MRRIDELHLEIPFFGARRLARMLQRGGFAIGRRHVGTLMRLMGIEVIYPKKRTSIPGKGQKITRMNIYSKFGSASVSNLLTGSATPRNTAIISTAV